MNNKKTHYQFTQKKARQLGQELLKTQKGTLKTDAPHTGAKSLQQREKAHYLPKALARVHPCGIGHGTSWPGSRSNSHHNHPGWRRNVDREGHPCAGRFAVSHSLEDERKEYAVQTEDYDLIVCWVRLSQMP